MRKIRRVAALPRRPRSAHKGDCGRVLVIAGCEGMLGAAILCASGALRGGAGLVRALLPRPLMAPFTVAVPCATTLARTAAALPRALADNDAVVVGPGLGSSAATKLVVREVLSRSRVPIVLDADALGALGVLKKPLRARAPVVLTPHPGEAARLLGSTSVGVQADREAALGELCRRSGVIVALKGEGTLVGDGAVMFRNSTGNPGMATGGSGDVLTGLLGAMLAEGIEPFDAACAAVHLHGKAGDLVSQRRSERGLIASDLPPAIAEVMS